MKYTQSNESYSYITHYVWNWVYAWITKFMVHTSKVQSIFKYLETLLRTEDPFDLYLNTTKQILRNNNMIYL